MLRTSEVPQIDFLIRAGDQLVPLAAPAQAQKRSGKCMNMLHPTFNLYLVIVCIYIYIYLYLYLSISIYIYISISLSISLSIHLSIHPSIHLSIYPSHWGHHWGFRRLAISARHGDSFQHGIHIVLPSGDIPGVPYRNLTIKALYIPRYQEKKLCKSHNYI